MDVPLEISDLSNHVNIRECTTRPVAIDDDNYQKVIDWFKSCLELSNYLHPSQRDEYELNLIGNVKNALASFFQQTELTLSTLIGLEREITSMFDSLSPPSGPKRKGNSESTTCEPEEPKTPSCNNPSCCEVEDAMGSIYKKLLWVTIASSILLLLLILILCTLCWLRKCIASDMKESFACCPSREDTHDDGKTKSNTTAFPVRVWFNPFRQKQDAPSKEKLEKQEKASKDEWGKAQNK